MSEIHREYYEDEINLFDYFMVLWRWKWVIIIGTLLCMIAAVIISLQLPKIYEISAVIEPGTIDVKGDGKFIYIDSTANISAKINGGIYDEKVRKVLEIDSKVGFKAVPIKGTDLVKVTSEWQEENTDLGMRAVQQMMRFLTDDYEEIVERNRSNCDKQISVKQNEIKNIETQRKDIDQQILMKQGEIRNVETQRKDIDEQINLKLNQIEKMRNKIQLQQATLGNIRQRKGELQKEIQSVEENTKEMLRQRDSLLKDKMTDKDKNLSLLIYSTTIQQNVSYFNQLSNQCYDLKMTESEKVAELETFHQNIADIKTGIGMLNLRRQEGLQVKIDTIKAEIERLNLKKEEELEASISNIRAEIDTLNLNRRVIRNIQIIQAPEVSQFPMKAKKKQIILLAGVVALFMFIFLAFFIEYIKNARREYLSGKGKE